ncbi:hypothetical protein ABZT43_50865, partial [Streptomyces sp. NPDC005349]|uniref:hypothetical protein n=1 Tax=Streptomyces sp. NPDC005349 TaxID=3157037 RepID=UPI0033B1C2E3
MTSDSMSREYGRRGQIFSARRGTRWGFAGASPRRFFQEAGGEVEPSTAGQPAPSVQSNLLLCCPLLDCSLGKEFVRPQALGQTGTVAMFTLPQSGNIAPLIITSSVMGLGHVFS